MSDWIVGLSVALLIVIMVVISNRNISPLFASRLLSRAGSIKETSPEVLERLRLLGCNYRDIELVVVEPSKKFPKKYFYVWTRRSILPNPIGCIYVKFWKGKTWYQYPFNFDIK